MKKLETNFKWDVIENPVYINGLPHPKKKAITRSDDGSILSIKSDRYRAFKNQDFQELIDRLVRLSNFTFIGYQEFQNGKRILGFLKNNNPNLKLCGQKVEDYLIIGNSHDGTSKMFIGTSNYMFRCENQFSDKIRSFELTHIHELDFSDQALLELLNVYETSRKNYYHSMEALQLAPITPGMIRSLVKEMLGNEQHIPEEKHRNDLTVAPPMSYREQMFRASIAKETKALGNNLWGLFNGVTHFATHHIKGNAFLNSSGSALEFNQRGLEACLKLFKQN